MCWQVNLCRPSSPLSPVGRPYLFTSKRFLFVLMGEGIFIGRLLSAFVGILTVGLTYTTGKVLFNRWIGLIAAAFLAVSLWHLIASRNGYRAVIQPLIQLPVILLLFYGLSGAKGGGRERGPAQGASWIYFLLAGIFLGLTQYTYTAVRLFPILIVLIILLVWLIDRETIYKNLGNLAITRFSGLPRLFPAWLVFLSTPPRFLRPCGSDLRIFARMVRW